MNTYMTAYDQFWHDVETHPDERVRRILPTKGRQYGSLTVEEKADHRVAIDLLRKSGRRRGR